MMKDTFYFSGIACSGHCTFSIQASLESKVHDKVFKQSSEFIGWSSQDIH